MVWYGVVSQFAQVSRIPHLTCETRNASRSSNVQHPEAKNSKRYSLFARVRRKEDLLALESQSDPENADSSSMITVVSNQVMLFCIF